jgi:hypothetical protein
MGSGGGGNSMNIPDRDKGPVEILCGEIGFRFDKRLETVDMLVAFVAELVKHIAQRHEISKKIADICATKPSELADEGLRLVRHMLEAEDRETLIRRAAALHDYSHRVNPDEGPCDHYIDMLSSCASAIRFGLEVPCRSRHAAAAAGHVWDKTYGIQQFDEFTSNWQKDWARAQVEQAIIGRMACQIKQ